MPKRAEPHALDKIDLKILKALQEDGRLPNVALAERVNLSPTPCLERVRRLEREGFITGYAAKLNPERLDASLLVFVEIRLNSLSPGVFDQFSAAVTSIPEVMGCYLVSGDFDFLIRARVRDVAAYRRLLVDQLLPLPGVSGTQSYVVMDEIKNTASLPLQ